MQNCINTFVFQKTHPHLAGPQPSTPQPFPVLTSIFFGDAYNSGGEALFDVMGSLVICQVNEINLSWILRQGSMPTIWQWESLRKESVLGLCPITKRLRESRRIMRVQHELKISLKIGMGYFSLLGGLGNLGCFGFVWGQSSLLCCRFQSEITWIGPCFLWPGTACTSEKNSGIHTRWAPY